ncbi:MAG: hypothetical protein KF892_08560 [Rhizobacter sp.]|nr:hypothetical protein [Rhizobacter sp.]
MSLPNPAESAAVLTSNSLHTITRNPGLKASTVKAYEKDMKQYRDGFGGKLPCDAKALNSYISWLRSRVRPTTIHRRLMALRYEHLRLGHTSPTDAPTMRTVMRQLQLGMLPAKQGSTALPKKREPRQARPITRALLARMLDAMGGNLLDRRDRCLLLLGFTAMLSRSTLVSLDVADVRIQEHEMSVRVRDEQPEGKTLRIIIVPKISGDLCAARAAKEWIEHAALDLEGGPLFRRFDRGGNPTTERLDAAWVSVVLKTRLNAVGVESKNFSGQSLRRGRLAELKGGAA